MQDMYERLRIPGWTTAEPVLQRYVDGLKGYETNRLKKISKRERDAVYQEWRAVFDAFGYDREYPPVEPVHADQRFQPGGTPDNGASAPALSEETPA